MLRAQLTQAVTKRQISVPSHDGKAGLSCVMRAITINKLIFVETLNSGQTLIHILTPVFENLSHYDRTYTVQKSCRNRFCTFLNVSIIRLTYNIYFVANFVIIKNHTFFKFIPS